MDNRNFYPFKYTDAVPREKFFNFGKGRLLLLLTVASVSVATASLASAQPNLDLTAVGILWHIPGMADEPLSLHRPSLPIIWREPIPPEVKAAITPYLTRFAPLFPRWIEDLTVAYDSDSDLSMAATINYRNRWAILRVTGEWLTLNEREREAAFFHEVTHMLLAPLHDRTQRIKEGFLKDHAYAQEMIDDGYEAVCEDTARAIQRVYLSFSPLK